jgi:hypothetical protein
MPELVFFYAIKGTLRRSVRRPAVPIRLEYPAETPGATAGQRTGQTALDGKMVLDRITEKLLRHSQLM